MKHKGGMVNMGNDSSMLSSVKNTLLILKSFNVNNPTMRVSDLAKSLGLAKSTVSRIMKTLASEGFVVKDPKTKEYRLGLTILTLGGLVSNDFEFNQETIPVLNEVVEKTKETAHLAILDGLDTIYIKKKECNHPVRILTHIGRRNPAYCTSSGKVLLAFHNENLVEEIIDNGLYPFTKNTITNPDILRSEIKKIKEQGYAVSTEELTEGTRSVAAPIRDHTGKVIYAINVVGPIQRMHDYKIPSIARILMHAANETSVRLGYNARLFKS